MEERSFHIAGAVFLTTLTIAMARLGHRQGGVAWAVAWISLYLAGWAGSLLPNYPYLIVALPVLGTVFATFLLGGTLIFTGRARGTPHSVLIGGASITALRVIALPFISFGASQAVGAVLIVSAALASMYLLFHPADRGPSEWERRLGYAFPAVAGTAIYFAWTREVGVQTLQPMLLWQGVGNCIAFLQVAAYVARNSERMDTLRLQAERSRDAHAQAEAQYREVTEQASDMIMEVDEEGQILYANPAHQAILGYTPDDLIGRTLDSIFQIDPVDRPNAIRNLVFSKPSHQHIFRILHVHGGVRVIESNMRRFERPGEGKHVVMTSRDITARVASERKLAEDRDQLQTLVRQGTDALEASLSQLEKTERLAAIGTLAAGIAHQINNPIGSILLASDFALRVEDSVEREKAWREALENSVEQSNRCGRIVSNILQFARNEPTLKTEEDLVALVRRVHGQADVQARLHGAKVETRYSADTLPVLGSAIALEQALLNVVQNAIQSSSESTEVGVHVFREAEKACVVVSDNGVGMRPEEAEHAFDPFFTTRLGHGGTGLGLSVAHGVIMDHGGSIQLESEPGRGTVITVSLSLRSAVETTDLTPVA